MSATGSLCDARLIELRALLKTALEVANDLDKIRAGEGSRPSSPVAPDGPETAIAIDRRIQLRKSLVLSRLRDQLVVVAPDELEALLDSFEHGGFSTREWDKEPNK